MKITIIPEDSVVGIDGVFRQVSMEGLDQTIHAVQFDTATSNGHVEFLSDLHQDNLLLSDFAPYRGFVDKWTAMAPSPPLPPTPEQVANAARLEELSAAISADTQITALKTMTNAQFDVWWDANVTTAAQAIAVLKHLVRVMIQRLL